MEIMLFFDYLKEKKYMLTIEYLKTLTLEERQKTIIKEFVKIKKDPVYCIENYFTVLDSALGRRVPFKLYPHQRRAVNDFEAHSSNLTMKTRQMGFTAVSSAYVAYYMITKQNQIINALAQEKKTSRKFLRQVRETLDNARKTAPWLVADYVFNNNGKDSFTLKTGCIITAEANKPDACRGDTINLLIIDEVAAISHMEEIWSSAGLTLTKSKGKCIGISTPKGASGWYFDQYSNALENGWNIIEAHWSEHPDYKKGMYQFIKDVNHKEGGYIKRFNEDWPDVTEEAQRRKYFTKSTYPYITDGKLRSPWYDFESKRLGVQKTRCELDCSFAGSGSEVLDAEVIRALRLSAREVPLIDPSLLGFETKGMWKSLKVFKEYNPEHGYVCSCLPPGEQILTTSGYKNIEKVTLLDTLPDKDGITQTILNLQKREYEGYIYDIKVSNINRGTKFTYNHPIYSSKKIGRSWIDNKAQYKFDFQFIDAENINPGDWLKYPNVYKNKVLSPEELLSHWELNTTHTRKDFEIPNLILTTEFWWFVGIWLAEGWVSVNKKGMMSVMTCHNKTEKEFIDKIKTFASSLGKTVTLIEKESTTICTFNSKELGTFLQIFGKGAKNKIIPEFVKYLPIDLKAEFLKGYWQGDGCCVKNINGATINFASASEKLIWGIQDILFSLGIISAHQTFISSYGFGKEKSTVNHLNCGYYYSNKFFTLINFPIQNKCIEKTPKTSSCFFSDNEEYIYFKVRSIEKTLYNGLVYNFETENHTYLAHGITTHNCDVATGDGSDYSAISVMDLTSNEIVATYKEHVDPIMFAKIIKSVALYYGECMVIVEYQGPGLTVLLELKNNLRYNKIFHSTLKKAEPTKPQKRKIGFWQGQSTRTLGGDKLEESMNTNQLRIYSDDVISEFDTWIWDTDGKRRHAPGKTDDLIMSICNLLFYVHYVLPKQTMNKSMMQSQFARISSGNMSDNTELFDWRDLLNKLNVNS